MDKMKKTAETLDNICKVICFLTAFAALLCVILVVVLLALKDNVLTHLQAMNGSVHLNGTMIVLTLPQKWNAKIDMVPMMIRTFCTSEVLAGITVYGLSLIHHMLQPMKEGKPFDAAVRTGFRKLGRLAVISGVLQNVIGFVGTKMIYNSLSSTFRSYFQAKEQYTLNLNFVLAAAAFFLMSYVFHYGEELQNLSDETL